MKIVVIGDLHLDARIAGRDYFDDVMERLNAIDLTGVSCLIQLGDICDPDSGPRTFRALYEFSRWIEDRDFQTHVVVGNHDRIDDVRAKSCLSPLRREGVEIHDEPFLTRICSGLIFLFLPWLSRAHGETDPTERVLQQLDSLPDTHKVLVFCHLDIEGAVPGSETEMPRLGAQFLSQKIVDHPKVEKVFAGHIHKRQTLGKVEIVGSLERLGMGERDDQKGWLEIEI